MKLFLLACLFSCIAFGEQSAINPLEKDQELKTEEIQLLQKIAELLRNSASLDNEEVTTSDQQSSNIISDNHHPLRLPASAEELAFLQMVAEFLQNNQPPLLPLPEETISAPEESPVEGLQGITTKALIDVPSSNCPGYQARDMWGRCRSLW